MAARRRLGEVYSTIFAFVNPTWPVPLEHPGAGRDRSEKWHFSCAVAPYGSRFV
jgi:hypothetical protein